MTIEQQLLDLKSRCEQLNTLKIETKTKLDGLEQERDVLLTECKELGVDPTAIEETIKNEEDRLQQEISTLSEQAEKVLDELSKI
jgi:predicted nuclease with TOPRIM domain